MNKFKDKMIIINIILITVLIVCILIFRDKITKKVFYNYNECKVWEIQHDKYSYLLGTIEETKIYEYGAEIHIVYDNKNYSLCSIKEITSAENENYV